MYEMNPEYLIGVELMDTQHQTLFELMKKARVLLKDQNILYKYDDLTLILKGLKEYTEKHFSDEIRLMEACQYPELEIHKEAHNSFVKKIETFHIDIDKISLGTQDSIISNVLDYLAEWLQIHILDFDRKAAIYVRENSPQG